MRCASPLRTHHTGCGKQHRVGEFQDVTRCRCNSCFGRTTQQTLKQHDIHGGRRIECNPVEPSRWYSLAEPTLAKSPSQQKIPRFRHNRRQRCLYPVAASFRQKHDRDCRFGRHCTIPSGSMSTAYRTFFLLDASACSGSS